MPHASRGKKSRPQPLSLEKPPDVLSKPLADMKVTDGTVEITASNLHVHTWIDEKDVQRGFMGHMSKCPAPACVRAR